MKKKNNKNKIIKITGLVVALALIAGATLELTGVTHVFRKKATPVASVQPHETINYEPATEQEKTQVETSKTSDDQIKDGQNQTTPTTTPADKNVLISSTEQQSSKDVIVQTQLYGIGWQSCTLTLTLGDKKVVKTAETLYQQSFSTCLGFSVPYSDLGEPGTWQIDLTVTNSDGQTHNATPTSLKVAS